MHTTFKNYLHLLQTKIQTDCYYKSRQNWLQITTAFLLQIPAEVYYKS